MKIPTAHQVVKTAGLTELGTAAAIGALLGRAADAIPMIAQLRTTNPQLYDAALAAGTVRVLQMLEETEIQHDASLQPMRAV